MEQILPFCRSNIKNFEFKLFHDKIEKCPKLVFNFNNAKVKISENLQSEKYIIFGKYQEKYVVACETDKISNDFHHIMGKYFSKFEDLRTLAGIGYALINWDKETKYCGKCGKILKFSKKENVAKICSSCNTTYFPRLNPAIIVAVIKDKTHVLVTRKPEWKGNRYGLIAGFIEYGENIEETAKREITEETGIKVKNIKYISSQFWPFPYQIMIGLTAEYESGYINIDNKELCEAKWLNIKNISEEILPPPSSIARFLFEFIIKMT